MRFVNVDQGGRARACGLGCRPSLCEQLDHRWLTANRSDLSRSMATSTDEPEPATCIDGRQRTALDGPGREGRPSLPRLGPRLARRR
jgi:hypothetical protein